MSGREHRTVNAVSADGFSALFDSGPAALVRVSPAEPHVVLSASGAFSCFGLAPDAATGMDPAEFIHPDDAAAFARAASTPPATAEIRIVAPDGRTRWAILRTAPAEDAVHALFIDITSQKTAEEALTENRMLFKVIADAASSAIIVRRADGSVSYVSPSFETIFGLPAETVRRSPDSMFDLLHPDDRERILAKGMSLMKHPQTLPPEDFRITTPAGEEKLIRQTCTPIYDDDGAFIGIRSSNRDVTVETQTRQKLARSEERLALAMKAANDGLWDWNVITGESHFSPRWAAMLGFAAEEINTFQDFFYAHIHEDDTERVEAAMLAHLAGDAESYTTEYRMRRKDGRIIWVRDRGLVVNWREDGVPERMIGIISDITERKNAENEARHASLKAVGEKKKLDAVIAAIGDGLAIRDREQRLVFQNRQYRALLDARTGHHCSDVYRCGRDGCGSCNIRSATEAATVVTSLKTVETHGKRRYFEVTASGLRDGEGEIFGAVEMVRDITDRVQAERVLVEKKKELEELNRTLEARVGEEISRRREQEQILIQQSKMAAMGEMMGAIAHQWRQPLNAIGLLVQDIEDAFVHAELNRDYIDDFVAQSMAQIMFMSTTIDDFRNFFRPAKKMTVFDVKIATDEVLQLLSSQIRSAGITVNTLYDCEAICGKEPGGPRKPLHQCRSGMLQVNGYYNEFKQVIMNIINNAREAIIDTHAGNDDDEKRRIDICLGLEDGGDTVAITVNDTGGGIPGHILDRIFDPYFSTKEEGRGTGIGLYMSKAIIEQNMKGSIRAANTRDGASVTIRLARVF